MDAKTILAFILMILIYIFFFQPGPPSVATVGNQVSAPSTVEVPPEGKRSLVEPSGAASDLARKIVKMNNGLVSLELNGLGIVQRATFLKYVAHAGGSASVEQSFIGDGFNYSHLDTSEGSPHWKLIANNELELELGANLGAVKLSRKIKLLEGSYSLSFLDRVENHESRSIRLSPQLVVLHPAVSEPSPSGIIQKMFSPQAEIHELVYERDGSVHRVPFQKVHSGPKETGLIGWAGFAHKYFFYGLIPKTISGVEVFSETTENKSLRQMVNLTEKTVAPGDTSEFEYDFYLGPKEIPNLVAITPDLKEVVDYGSWIGSISRLLLSILHFFYKLIPNYGVGIVLLTILVKIVLFPLAYKSAVSMRRLQLVQPKMKEIRDRYKDDKQRMNMEMMALYRNEKVNPVGGCLPILLQMPVFFALYRVFFASIEFRHAPFFGWIKDLSVYDPFFVTPVLMTILMWYQTKLTPQPAMGDESEAVQVQRAMMKWMPVIFGAIMIFLPSGLTLYFLVNALISLLQQIYLNRHLSKHFPMATA